MDDFSRLKMSALRFDPSPYEDPELVVRVALMQAALILDDAGRALPVMFSPDYEAFIRAQRRVYERSCEELVRRAQD